MNTKKQIIYPRHQEILLAMGTVLLGLSFGVFIKGSQEFQTLSIEKQYPDYKLC